MLSGLLMSIKIASFNVHGLGDNVKRRQIFHYLHEKLFDVVLVQESHSTVNIEQRWRSEWGGNIFFSHRTSSARGVMILVSKKACLTMKEGPSF